MNNKSQQNNELPSTKRLLFSTILAMIFASLILITTVLPAEYGIDPSGVGDIIGLTKMGKIKVSLAEEAAELDKKKDSKDLSISSLSPEKSKLAVEQQSGVMTITLKPNEGNELKVFMKKDDEIKFSWWTNGPEINFDSHTDSDEYHNYSKGLKKADKGKLKAVYDGRHGWWWKNRSSQKITITLEVEGKYADLRVEP